MNQQAEDAKRYRERAAKLQTTAANMHDAAAAKTMLRKAAEYEYEAECRERRLQPINAFSLGVRKKA
jgi:hypothetical protein